MSYIQLYSLDRNNQPVPHADGDWLAWAEWMEAALLDGRRRVAETDLGGVSVSTVFLGQNHRHRGEGPPILFESMIFGNAPQVTDGRQWRCCTWQQAVEMHERVVDLCKAATAAN